MNAIEFSPYLLLLARVSLLLVAVVLLLVGLRKFEPRLRVMAVRVAVYLLPILIWGSFGAPIYEFDSPFQTAAVESSVVAVDSPVLVSANVTSASAEPPEENFAGSFGVGLTAAILITWLTIALILLRTSEKISVLFMV